MTTKNVTISLSQIDDKISCDISFNPPVDVEDGVDGMDAVYVVAAAALETIGRILVAEPNFKDNRTLN